MNLNVFLICKDLDCADKMDSKGSVLQAVKDAIATLNAGSASGSVEYYTATLDSDIAKSAGIKFAPTVLIVDADTQRVVGKQASDPINGAMLKNSIVDIVTNGVEPGSGDNGGGIIPGGTPGGDLLGLGIFNLGLNIPTWVWLALAGVAVYKASTAKSGLAVAGFGAAGLVAGLNYLNKKKAASVGNLGTIEYIKSYGNTYYLTTSLDLSGAGIKMAGDGSDHARGLKTYHVTTNAFNRLKANGYKMVLNITSF